MLIPRILGGKWREGVSFGTCTTNLLLHDDQITWINCWSSFVKFKHRNSSQFIIFSHQLVVNKHSMSLSSHWAFVICTICWNISWILGELSLVAVFYNFIKFVYFIQNLAVDIIEEGVHTIMHREFLIFQNIWVDNPDSFEQSSQVL